MFYSKDFRGSVYYVKDFYAQDAIRFLSGLVFSKLKFATYYILVPIHSKRTEVIVSFSV